MARTPKSPDPKTSVTARFDSLIINEIDEMAEAMLSDRTTIMQECLNLGLGELIRQRPEILQIVEAHRKRKKLAKTSLKSQTGT